MKKLILVLMILVIVWGIGDRIKNSTSNSKPGFIIITAISPNSFTDFIEFKKQKYNVKVFQIDEIKKNSYGVDIPEQIRNSLRANVTNEDKYLLLIGEPTGNYTWNSTGGDLPMRFSYPIGKNWDWRVATDYYYADLEGNWDKDNDSVYGEVNDDEINWKPNLIVGRIPSSDPLIVRSILYSYIEFEKQENLPENMKQKKACLAMSTTSLIDYDFNIIALADLSKVGETLKDQLKQFMEVITLYEKEGDFISPYECSAPLNKKNFELNIQNSDIVIADQGHRWIWNDTNKNGKVDQGEDQYIAYCENDLKIENPISIFFKGGTYSADPLNKNNFLKSFLLNGKIRSGLGFTSGDPIDPEWEDLNNGRFSGSLLYLFINYLVSEGKAILGEVLSKTFNKYFYLYRPLNDFDFMTLLGLNYLGDPTLELKIDTIPPEIKINSLPEFTNQKNIIIKCEVNDNSNNLSLFINDQLVDFKNNTFEIELSLQEGENEIKIYALDQAENKSEKIIKIVYDPILPEININLLPEVTNQQKIIIKGEVRDNIGLEILTINNEVVEIYNNNFEKEILLKENENLIKIIAIDKAGNKTEKIFTIYLDTTPPDIFISVPTETYESNILLIGKIKDSFSGIESFRINGNIVNLTSDGSFTYNISLYEGDNRIKFELIDKAGNKTIKEVKIKYIKRIIIKLQIGNKIMFINETPQEIDIPPQIIEGRTYLPIRWIAEPLGAVVVWDGKEKKVTVTLKDTVIELWVNKNMAKVNGVNTAIDPNNSKVVPLIISGRTMLPIRFIVENLGCQIDWDAQTKTIIIIYPR